MAVSTVKAECKSDVKKVWEMADTVLKVADYSNEEKKKLTKRMHVLFIAGLAAMVIYLLLLFTGDSPKSPVVDFISGVRLGIAFGMLVVA